MREVILTEDDKLALRKSIRISLITGLLFFIALVVIVAIVPGVLFLLGKKSADGFVNRGLMLLGLLFIPFLPVFWQNILKYVDIKKGKKLEIVTTDYEVQKTKRSVSLRLKDNDNRKIKIWDELLPLIDVRRPLKIDITILSKELIFISHDNKNLLD